MLISKMLHTATYITLIAGAVIETACDNRAPSSDAVGTSQQSVTYPAYGSFMSQNGLCLQYQATNAAPILAACTSSGATDATQWSYGTDYSIRPVGVDGGTGYCLSYNAQGVVSINTTCGTPTASEQWYVWNGRIISAANTSDCLDIEADDDEPGTAVDVAACSATGTGSQQWTPIFFPVYVYSDGLSGSGNGHLCWSVLTESANKIGLATCSWGAELQTFALTPNNNITWIDSSGNIEYYHVLNGYTTVGSNLTPEASLSFDGGAQESTWYYYGGPSQPVIVTPIDGQAGTGGQCLADLAGLVPPNPSILVTLPCSSTSGAQEWSISIASVPPWCNAGSCPK